MTDKQQAFVNEYLIDLNATQAAIRAGYSKKTARSQGQRLLTYADIAAATEVATKERAERTQVSQDEVIDGLKREASYFGEGSSHSARVSAFTQLGRHLGMFTDKTDVNLNVWGRLSSMTDRELRELEALEDEYLAKRLSPGA